MEGKASDLSAYELAELKKLSQNCAFSYDNLLASYITINSPELRQQFTEQYRINRFGIYCTWAASWGYKLMPVTFQELKPFFEHVQKVDKNNFEHQVEKYRKDLDFYNQNKIENVKAIFEYANMGIRSLVLSNGGAIIALLSLMGTIWKEDPETIKIIMFMLFYFGIGLSSILLTTFFAYFTQYHILQEHEDLVEKFRHIAICTALLSWGLFTIGVVHTLYLVLCH